MTKFSSPFLAKSPLNNGDKKYKKGDILGEGMPEIEASGINIENFSDVQKDKQGQFVTTLGDDEHAAGADTSSSTIMPNALRPNVRVARDTIRPSSGKKFTISNKKTNYGGGSPLNEIKLKKRGRVAHEYFSGEGLKAKNTEQQTSTGVGINVEDRDWETKDVKDPKGVLDRPMTTREHNKGYRVKREKDGSVTLKGRRGN